MTPGELFDSPGIPTQTELETADALRALHLKHHPKTPLPIKTDRGWHRHRPMWAVKLARIRGEVDLDALVRAAEAAYADRKPWRHSAACWHEVLGRCANPVDTLIRNLPQLMRAADRVRKPKHAIDVRRHRIGDHYHQTYYYLNDREISRERYHQLARENKENGY